MEQNNSPQLETNTQKKDKTKIVLSLLVVGLFAATSVFAWLAFQEDDPVDSVNTSETASTDASNQAEPDTQANDQDDQTSDTEEITYRTYEYENASFDYPEDWSVVTRFDSSANTYIYTVVSPGFYTGRDGNADFSCPTLESGMSFAISSFETAGSSITAEQILAQSDDNTTTFFIDPVEIEREGVLAVRSTTTPGECGYNYTAQWEENGRTYTVSTPLHTTGPEDYPITEQQIEVLERIAETYSEL